jgi:hypothetical protein
MNTFIRANGEQKKFLQVRVVVISNNENGKRKIPTVYFPHPLPPSLAYTARTIEMTTKC